MDAHELVVLTQNAWGGAPLWTRRRERLARAIADLQPDVAGLQEIHAPTPSGEGSQAHELAEIAGGYDAWFVPGRVTENGACEGVALLIRRGLEVVERSSLNLSLDAGDALEGRHQRVVLRASVRRGGAIVDVLATHLSLSKRARERTIAEVVSFAARERKRSGSSGAVLVGDFNATPLEPALMLLDGAAGWLDAWEQANPDGSGATWPAAVPFRRIDYVWVRPGAGWSIAECRRMPIAGSDHVGLWARVAWPQVMT
jgi:endonuclease/exonuclease/phosphatase family metal-dependent hydrolase